MTTRPAITIVETGVANTASVRAAFTRLGFDTTLARDPKTVATADRLILPGVGAFAAGMNALTRSNLTDAIRARLERDRPTLAICLGMHLLGAASEESPGVAGLRITNTVARAFPPGVRSPHFGWNRVIPASPDVAIGEGFAYFANSYRITDPPEGWDVATTDHAGLFVAAMRRGATLASQFHPELSGPFGTRLLEAWATQRKRAATC